MPDWCKVLRQEGWDTIHWSEIGKPTATDNEVLSYAKQTLSAQFHDLFIGSLRRFRAELDAGAIVVVEQSRARVRILPLTEKP